MKIGEVASRVGLNASTLRYYEEIGLLPAPERISGQRHYEADILQTIQFIKLAQRAGFQLADIRMILSGSAETVSEQWRTLAQDKLSEIDTIIQQYHVMKQLLLDGLECGCVDLSVCDLIEPIA